MFENEDRERVERKLNENKNGKYTNMNKKAENDKKQGRIYQMQNNKEEKIEGIRRKVQNLECETNKERKKVVEKRKKEIGIKERKRTVKLAEEGKNGKKERNIQR